ncbi:MAG TPA: IPT/TIG domain-containing protein, partial [Planctomycetota bacterium]
DEMRALAGGHDAFATAVRLTTSALNPATLYTMTASGVQDLAGAAIDPTVAARPFRFYPAGTITNEQYRFDPNGGAIGGGRVQDLVRNASFPNNPSGASQPALYETPTNVFENYGGRVRGWLLPSASGWYRLSLATDDGGLLFLSPNDDPTHKAVQSFCWEWTGVRTYVDPEVAQSPAVQLTAGEKYYVELLFKEGGGGDNAAVAMIPLTGPTDPATIANATAPIAGALLAPFVEPPVITVQPRSFVLMPGQPLLLTVDVSGSGPRTYQWRRDGAPINGATTSRLAVAAADAGTYSVVVTCGTDTVTSADAVVTVVAPPAPTLSAAVPVSGPVSGAQAVELTGTHLLFDVTTLRFGGTAATELFSFAGGTRAIVRTPPHAAGLVDVTVATPGGAGAAPGAYTYYGPPTATAVAPDAGPVAGGQTVTLSGANFVPGQTQVAFDGVAATSVVVTGFSTLTASTPAHAAGRVAVTVTTPHGAGTLVAGYIYFDPPTLTSVAPAHGPVAGGQAVVLTGTQFISGRTAV